MDAGEETAITRLVVRGPYDEAYNNKIDRKYDEALQYHYDNFPKRPEIQAYHFGAALWLTGAYDLACQRWLAEIQRLRAREAQSTDGAGGVIDPAMLWWRRDI